VSPCRYSLLLLLYQRMTSPNDVEPVLSIDPDAAHFLITGGKSEHMLVNTGEKRIAVKVRCSDNSLFRVCPVYMFVEAGSCNNLVITRLPGPPKVDKLVFHYVPCTERDIDPKDVFKKKAKPESIKLPMDTITPDDALQFGAIPAVTKK
uniref:Major sperm protein n=2 Tax=Parascaris univalens TaxID=6257 RepID=A0A914ZSI1_PARUN